MEKIYVLLVMPDEKLFDNFVETIKLPGVEGSFEVLSHHSPFITQLRSGTIIITNEDHVDYFAVHDGFVTVEQNKIIILSENCEHADKIDRERAQKSKARAEKRIAETSNAKINFRRAEASLRRAVARINTLNMIT